MTHPPQQPWDQPQPGPVWGQQPAGPSWGQQQPAGPPSGQQPAWGTPPRPATSGGVPLLVLGLVTAVLGLLGSLLPSVTYSEGDGYFGPLYQSFGDFGQFQAGGLVLLLGVGLLVAGAVVQRGRAGVGTGLLLVGSGVFVDAGLGLLLSRLQSLSDSGLSTGTGIGGVLLMLAGAVAAATAVVGLLRLARR